MNKIMRFCAVCSCEFLPRHERQPTCGAEACRGEWKRQAQAIRRDRHRAKHGLAPKPRGICSECSVQIPSTRGRKAVTCSAECARFRNLRSKQLSKAEVKSNTPPNVKPKPQPQLVLKPQYTNPRRLNVFQWGYPRGGA